MKVGSDEITFMRHQKVIKFVSYSTARDHVYTLREGPFSQGASWAVCGSGVPTVRFFKFEWYFRKIGKPYFA